MRQGSIYPAGCLYYRGDGERERQKREGRSLFAFFTTANANSARIRSFDFLLKDDALESRGTTIT